MKETKKQRKKEGERKERKERMVDIQKGKNERKGREGGREEGKKEGRNPRNPGMAQWLRVLAFFFFSFSFFRELYIV